MPPADRRSVRVRILDREYAFASQGEETDRRIERVAGLLDEKMCQVRQSATASTPMQTAVLAGLELVDELLRMQQDVSSVEQDISQRTHRLTESLGQLFRELDLESTPSAPRFNDLEADTSAASRESDGGASR